MPSLTLYVHITYVYVYIGPIENILELQDMIIDSIDLLGWYKSIVMNYTTYNWLGGGRALTNDGADAYDD